MGAKLGFIDGFHHIFPHPSFGTEILDCFPHSKLYECTAREIVNEKKLLKDTYTEIFFQRFV